MIGLELLLLESAIPVIEGYEPELTMILEEANRCAGWGSWSSRFCCVVSDDSAKYA